MNSMAEKYARAGLLIGPSGPLRWVRCKVLRFTHFHTNFGALSGFRRAVADDELVLAERALKRHFLCSEETTLELAHVQG